MYLIADTTEYELPLAIAETLSELAQICNTTVPIICRTMKRNSTTKLFNGIPAKIYKISENDAA